MPTDETTFQIPNFLSELNSDLLIKAFLVLFVVFYAVFSLILYRQMQLMDRAIPTPIGPFLKFIGILQIGIAIGFLFIVIGAF